MGNALCGGGGFRICGRFGWLRVYGFGSAGGVWGFVFCVFFLFIVPGCVRFSGARVFFCVYSFSICSANASGLWEVFYVLWCRFQPLQAWMAFSCCSASKISRTLVSLTVLWVSQVSSLGEYPCQWTKYWTPQPVPYLVRILSTSHSSSPSIITGSGLASFSLGCVWYGSNRETWKTGWIWWYWGVNWRW